MRGSSQKKWLRTAVTSMPLSSSGHHRIDLILREHKIAHHDVHVTGALGHRHPAAKAERGWRLDVGHGDAEIVPWNVDFQHIGFVVALPTERRQDLLVRGWCFLCAYDQSGRCENERCACDDERFH